jgi:hypothetical protein
LEGFQAKWLLVKLGTFFFYVVPSVGRAQLLIQKSAMLVARRGMPFQSVL